MLKKLFNFFRPSQETEAFHSVKWVCPFCTNVSISRIDTYYGIKILRCFKCKSNVTGDDFYDKWGEFPYPKDVYFPYLFEFICEDCGIENTITCKHEIEIKLFDTEEDYKNFLSNRKDVKESESGQFKYYKDNVYVPTKGICKSCHKKYRLITVSPYGK